VKYLDGDIQIQSELHKGTSIKITISAVTELDHVAEERPRIKLQEEVAEPKIMDTVSLETADAGSKTRYTLLIVEDNRELLTFLSKHFAKTYEVMTASNGLLALKKIHKTPPDIIISDVKMPKMDGIDLCNRLKIDKRFN